MAEALREFHARAAVHAAALGVRVTRIGLSDAATRWGSATADGAIRLHWRLIQLAPDLLDAVVAHEVAHLREMNHGPRFWALMARLVADPAGTRRRLRDAAASLAPF
jgi:predicted metal-dependent hydrolase